MHNLSSVNCILSDCFVGLVFLGPFSDCIRPGVIDAESFFDDCKYDTCITYPNQGAICELIEYFATLCSASGAYVDGWRNEEFCRKFDPLTMVFLSFFFFF